MCYSNDKLAEFPIVIENIERSPIVNDDFIFWWVIRVVPITIVKERSPLDDEDAFDKVWCGVCHVSVHLQNIFMNVFLSFFFGQNFNSVKYVFYSAFFKL